MPAKIPREELLDELHSLHEELGRAPSMTEMDEQGQHSGSPYVREFGNWNGALEAAGLETHGAGFKSFNRDIQVSTILNSIIDLTCELGYPPSRNEMEDMGECSAQAVRNWFGTWSGALRSVGLIGTHYTLKERIASSYTISREELLDELHRLDDELGHRPSSVDVTHHSEFGINTYRRRFSSWRDALKLAGFTPPTKNNVPVGELMDELHRLHDELGHAPSYSDMNERGKFSPPLYADRFGTWVNALDEAGYEPNWPLTGEDNPLWNGGYTPYYGPNWSKRRKQALSRDDRMCQAPGCGISQEEHRQKQEFGLDVHHITPLREFVTDGELDSDSANDLSNLITLCRACHAVAERADESYLEAAE